MLVQAFSGCARVNSSGPSWAQGFLNTQHLSRLSSHDFQTSTTATSPFHLFFKQNEDLPETLSTFACRGLKPVLNSQK